MNKLNDRQILTKAFHKIGYKLKRMPKYDYQFENTKYYSWVIENYYSKRQIIFYFNKNNKLHKFKEADYD